MLYNIFSILTSTFFLFSVLFFAGCARPETSADVDEDFDDTEAVYFETIGSGSQAYFDVRTETVVKDSVAWMMYQKKMETVLPFRHINFSQLMVAFVAVPSSHSGVTIQFESAERMDGELVFNYILGVPANDCRVIDTSSVPFQAIVIRKIDAPFRFQSREELQHCTFG